VCVVSSAVPTREVAYTTRGVTYKIVTDIHTLRMTVLGTRRSVVLSTDVISIRTAEFCDVSAK
jgi:hypothetical protein